MDTKANPLIDYAQKAFPEFSASAEYDVDNTELPYLFYGDLTRFFKTVIETKDEPKIKKIFDFINSFFDPARSDEEKELLSVEVFEEFAGYPETTELSRKFLNSSAREAFERVYKDYGYESKAN